MCDHDTIERGPYAQEPHRLAVPLAGIDEETARTILRNAQETAGVAWLQREICAGQESGEPVDGAEAFGRLKARAEARLKE